MVVSILLAVVIVIAIVHIVAHRIPNWLFIFLPLVFFLPVYPTLELGEMLGWVGLILIIAGSFADHFGDKIAERESDAEKKSRMSAIATFGFIATLIGIALTFVDQVNSENKRTVTSDEITRLSKENIELSKDNTRKQERISNLLTGGDSLFYIKFQNSFTMEPRPLMEVFGEHPIPQVNIEYFRIPTAEELADIEDKDAYRQNQLKRLNPIGPIFPGSGRFLLDFPFPNEGEANYRLFLSHGNKHQTQLVAIKRLADKTYRFAYRVYTAAAQSKNGKVQIRLIPELSHTDRELSPTGNHIVPALDFPENLPGFEVIK